LKIHRLQAEYNLLMGECKLQLKEYKDAVTYLSTAVRVRPKNISGWEALIRCLYAAGFYPEASQQAIAALGHTRNKSIFYYYLAAILFAMNKSKEAMLYLEKGLNTSLKYLRKFIQLNPAILQNPQVVDIIAQYKRTRG
jgi:tetratricopeptide (TPR) repeat protein